jgi:hypothetical protein
MAGHKPSEKKMKREKMVYGGKRKPMKKGRMVYGTGGNVMEVAKPN